MNFDDVLNDCISFLDKNPTECIIMSVKEEYDAANNTESFEKTFDSYVAKTANRWYLGSNIPTLNQARGKKVLVRRFSSNSRLENYFNQNSKGRFGITASDFIDNDISSKIISTDF